GTIETVALTIELVPAYRPYDYGRGYAYALFTIMPSLFWSPHPSVARGIPSVWLTETVDPFIGDEGGSIGFSFIADAFLNFGASGVPLFALLMGFAIVRLCQWGEGSTARLATVATFIPWLLFCARSELDFLPRPLGGSPNLPLPQASRREPSEQAVACDPSTRAVRRGA